MVGFGCLKQTGEVAQSFPMEIQGNAANMHHCVHTISSNRAMLKQEQGSLEIGVEFAADYNSLLGNVTDTIASPLKDQDLN